MTRRTVPLSFSHYDEITRKTQVVLSATGSTLSAQDWLLLPRKPRRIPGYVIDRDGTVFRQFAPRFWSEYLGIDERDRSVINIVLANCGALHRGTDGRFYPSKLDENMMPIADMEQRPLKVFAEFCSRKPYKGRMHYEMIYPEQLASLCNLLRHLIHHRGIEYHFDPQTGGPTPNFFKGVPGVYLAGGIPGCDKEIHPQVELINMLKAISL